jgi:uncharacterized coiled-coil DUF342 family protein
MEPRTGVSTGVVVLMSFLAPLAFAQGNVQKNTHGLVERAEETNRKIKEAGDQLRAVLEKYDKLLSRKSVEDRRNQHEEVSEELGKLEDRVKEMRKRTAELSHQAGKLFSEWRAGLVGIEDPGLRSISSTRLSETENGFAEIVAAGRAVDEQYETFVGTLGNHLDYLKLDMSDEALRQLKSSEPDLKEKANGLHSRIRDLMGTIERYGKALS